MLKRLLIPALLLLPSSPTIQAQNGNASGAAPQTIAATPPMGWNSWNHFAGRVTDKDVRAAADALVSSGMRDAGYVYVNIDDTWQAQRSADGTIQTNNRFPDMKALADYVHSKGLKLGIYSSPGPQTCAKFEGSYGHEEQDAKTYAAWGIDYLKYDLCGFHAIMKREAGADSAKANGMMRAAYAKMDKALKATGRPIVYSLCQYGFDSVWKWAPDVGGNLWRTTGDIDDTYDRMSVIGFGQAGLSKYARPGNWNDPDMLEIGNGKMTDDEYRTHMTLWVILAAPLLAGNDLSRMSPATLAMLTNRDVIAVDQDPLGKQGDRVSADGPFEIWAKPLSGGSEAVALFNRGEDAEAIPFRPETVNRSAGAKAKDLWTGKEFTLEQAQSIVVPRHGAVLLRIAK